MQVRRATDLSFERVKSESYDLALFASGYEARCTFVASQLDARTVRQAIVLGFSALQDHPDRQRHDDYFASRWAPRQHVIDGSDDGSIYPLLQAGMPQGTRSAKVLVDYSSMSRLWYAGVLNWARFACDAEEIALDFVYAAGEYPEGDTPKVIRDILCIPGCEGGPAPLYRSVAVFGLGFDSLASLCVLDRLEPDLVYSYVAEGSRPEYGQRVREANAEIIALSKATLELPLKSVEQAYRYLAELIEPHRADADTILVPMGPKPHVLAAILLAMRFPQVSCLRVSRVDRPEAISASGDVFCCRVELKKEPINSRVSDPRASLSTNQATRQGQV